MELSRPNIFGIRRDIHCYSVLIRIACVFLLHTDPYIIQDLKNLYSSVNRFRDCFFADPENTTRSLVLLHPKKEQVVSDELVKSILFTFSNIKSLFQQHPHTAILFLQHFMLTLSSKLISEELETKIQDVLLQARLNGQIEETIQLEMLLHHQ